MKYSTQQYIVSFILFILALIWTGAMVYAHNCHYLIIASMPFVMLSIIPIGCYSFAFYLFMHARDQIKLEKLNESFKNNYRRYVRD